MPCTMAMVFDSLPQYPHNHSPLPSPITSDHMAEYRRESSFPSNSHSTKTRPSLGPVRRYTFPLPSCFSSSPKPSDLSVKAPSTTTPPCSSLMMEAFPFPSHVPSPSILSSSSSSSTPSSTSISSALPTETSSALLTASTSSFHSSSQEQEETNTAETYFPSSPTLAIASSLLPSSFDVSFPSTTSTHIPSVTTISHSPISTSTSASTSVSTLVSNLFSTNHVSTVPSSNDTVAQTLAPLQISLDTAQDIGDQVAVTLPFKNQEGGKAQTSLPSSLSSLSSSPSCAARTHIIYRSTPLDQRASAFASFPPPSSSSSTSLFPTITTTPTTTLEPHPHHTHNEKLAPRTSLSPSPSPSHSHSQSQSHSHLTTSHHQSQHLYSPPPPPSLPSSLAPSTVLPPFSSLLPPSPIAPSSLGSDYLSHSQHSQHSQLPHNLGSHPMSSVTLSYSQHHPMVMANQAQHTDMAALALSQHHYRQHNQRSPISGRSPTSNNQESHDDIVNNSDPSLVQTPRPTPTPSSSSSVVMYQGSSTAQPPTPPPHFFPGPPRENDPHQEARQGHGYGLGHGQAHQHSSSSSTPASSSHLPSTSTSSSTRYAHAPSSTTATTTTTITSSASSSSLSRTPVRYRLADPRVRQFIPSKSPMLTASSFVASPHSNPPPNPAIPSDPPFSKTGPRQDFRFNSTAAVPSSSATDPHPLCTPGRHDPHSPAPNASSSPHDPPQPRRPSYEDDHRSTQSPLPSPVPSMTSLSPDLHARHHPYQPKYHAPYQPRPYYPQPDLSSPASEADLALDSKSSMVPLFHSSPSPSSAHRSSWSATSPHQRSHGSSVRTESGYPPSARRTPPPISTHAWSPKHHHHSIPMRSPVRQHGQELMTTSAIGTAPSEYMKMDYYDIYLQNPKLLRPEGGRNEAQGRYGSQRPRGTEPYEESRSYSTWSSGISRTKGRAPGSSDVIDSLAISSQDRRMKRPLLPPTSSSSSSGFARTQPMAIRNLLADDDHEDPSHRQSSLESYSHHDGRSSRFESDTEISESESMRWKEEDGDYVDRPYQYMASSSVMKRKQTSLDTSDPFGAPKKKRKSKKQAMAEAAAAAAAGISLPEDEPKKRKRTKKIQDPDHVSPTGFRHGGERVVQVPDELVVLEPDVGPVHMLDIESPPMVFWRGQPLSVVGKPGYDQLHPHEARIASTLRLSPAQYLSCKKTLILASRQFYAVKGGKQFRKSDAQKLCRIDVNKTSQLWEVFARIGWLEGLSAKDI